MDKNETFEQMALRVSEKCGLSPDASHKIFANTLRSELAKQAGSVEAVAWVHHVEGEQDWVTFTGPCAAFNSSPLYPATALAAQQAKIAELSDANKGLYEGTMRQATRIAELEDQLGKPCRHDLQKDGQHPAPCAKFCEANAFRIQERQLRGRIAELEEQIAKLKPDAERLKEIRRMCGYVEDGSDTTVSIFQDDATREWSVRLGPAMKPTGYYHANSFTGAIDAAIDAERNAK